VFSQVLETLGDRRNLEEIRLNLRHAPWTACASGTATRPTLPLHFTLPPYLCALYSLDVARNPEAYEVVASVLVEEMLHMTLTANLLNAVGGHPRLDSPRMLPGYPRCLPHGDCSFEVPLLRFSPEALDVFLKISSMYRLKVQAQALMEMPTEDGITTAGPTFEYVPSARAIVR
jgi:hypothetical protein